MRKLCLFGLLATVSAQSSESTLCGIELFVDKAPVEEGFTPEKLTYTLDIAHEIAQFEFELCVPSGRNATINGAEARDGERFLETFTEGIDVITVPIVVTAADGVSTTNYSIIATRLPEVEPTFSLCKDPAEFTPDQAIEVRCEGVQKRKCWNIVGFRWDSDNEECITDFWTRATPAMMQACKDAGGTPTPVETCESQEGTLKQFLLDSNVSVEVPLDTETCANLITGDTLGLEGAFYTFIHATTVCCGGQPHLGACDPDEPAICANPTYYTPDRYLRMRCYGVNVTVCNQLPGFEWERDRVSRQYVCTGPASGSMKCEEAMGSVDPLLTCGELNTMYSLLETRYQVNFDNEAGCSAFFSNVSSEFGEMTHVNPLLTNSFLNYVGSPLCCDSTETVCQAEDPYSVCATPSDFVNENPVRLECDGITAPECMNLDGFMYDFEDSHCITELFIEANEFYEDMCEDIGGTPVVPSTCAEEQALVTDYFRQMNLEAPFSRATCNDLLSETTDPLKALFWFEHLPMACCNRQPSACDFSPVEVCSDMTQFTPDAPAEVHCLNISTEDCDSLSSAGFMLGMDDNVCKTRDYLPVGTSANTSCTNIGGFTRIESTCAQTQTLATYMLGEHRIYNLSGDGQCQKTANRLDEERFHASYLFQHVPMACCGGMENAVCTASDLEDTCANRILFYQTPDISDCHDPRADDFSLCNDGCQANLQTVINDLDCCFFEWIRAQYGTTIPAAIILDRFVDVCSVDATSLEECDTTGTASGAQTNLPAEGEGDDGARTRLNVFSLLFAAVFAMAAEK